MFELKREPIDINVLETLKNRDLDEVSAALGDAGYSKYTALDIPPFQDPELIEKAIEVFFHRGMTTEVDDVTSLVKGKKYKTFADDGVYLFVKQQVVKL